MMVNREKDSVTKTRLIRFMVKPGQWESLLEVWFQGIIRFCGHGREYVYLRLVCLSVI